MTVLLALFITVMFGFLGLAVDVSHLYQVRTELQNAADAVALAGAGDLGDNGTLTGIANTILMLNKADNTALSSADVAAINWSYTKAPTTYYVYSISLKRTVRTSFIRVMSPYTTVRVTATASAQNTLDPYDPLKLAKYTNLTK